jgi:hypothetical protein
MTVQQPVLMSVKLQALLEEAQKLNDLKSQFGRLPDSKRRTFVLKAIETWYDQATLDSVTPSDGIHKSCSQVEDEDTIPF